MASSGSKLRLVSKRVAADPRRPSPWPRPCSTSPPRRGRSLAGASRISSSPAVLSSRCRAMICRSSTASCGKSGSATRSRGNGSSTRPVTSSASRRGDDPGEFAKTMVDSYRQDAWNQQPHRVEVWSEKGTVRGVLKPVLDKFAVGFRVMHGFSSATSVYDVAQSDNGRPLVDLYVGDWDPSGHSRSESALPARLKQYGGDHVDLRRVALTGEQVLPLQSFPATDKRKDPRYRWFTGRYGDQCWELDAMDPNDLRSCVEKHIEGLIERVAWERCETVFKQERASIHYVVKRWKKRLDNRRRAVS